MTWWNWWRTSPRDSMPAGQCTTSPSRVPPKCEAICLVHWYGVFMASAQPTGYMAYVVGPPISSMRGVHVGDVVGDAVTDEVLADGALRPPSPEAPLSPSM